MASTATGPALPRISDLAGRPRGSAFPADGHGTLLTSHEAVDGLSRLVVHPPEGRSVIVGASAVTALPEWDLALVHLPEPVGAPLTLGGADAPGAVLLARLGGAWTRTTVADSGPATYTATARFHALPVALHLALPAARAVPLRLSAEATGGPVLDAGTGAVVAVLVTAVHTARQAAGFAVPLRAAADHAPEGPVRQLLRHRRDPVPGPRAGGRPGLADVLRLTALAATGQVPAPDEAATGAPPARPEVTAALRTFERAASPVLALVGPPGTGRGSSLATYAARRAEGPEAAPTLSLRGADLRAGDTSVRDAVHRRLGEAARHAAAGPGPGPHPRTADPDAAARTARGAGRPLLVLLRAPEEMPAALNADLPNWCARTADWLGSTGARLVLACRPEYWENAGAHFPRAALWAPDPTPAPPGVPLPACHRLGDLTPEAAARASAALGLAGRVAPGEDRHPLSLRMLAAVRAAQPADAGGQPDRDAVFSAHLDLVALRVAERLAATSRGGATPRTVRRLAATVAGRIHEAARCSVGPLLLSRRAFDSLFPYPGGWANAVLGVGVLHPAGRDYRFADEEFADWLQARHLDLDAVLDLLLGPEPAGHRTAHGASPAGAGPPPVVPPPLPRHRIGPVVFALLRLGRERGPDALRRRLQRMVDVLPSARPALPPPGAPPAVPWTPDRAPDQDTRPAEAPSQPGTDAHWWACHLLGEVLLRLPDASRQAGVARQLAERVGAGTVPPARFGGWFWRRIALPTPHRVELLRLLLPADPPRTAPDRYLTAVAGLLAAEPRTVRPLLCRWFDDERRLTAHGGTTVAAAAQALLHTHRGGTTDQLADVLIEAAHPRANAVLDDLVQDEPAALSHAVLRWAGDERPIRRAAAAAHGPHVQRHAPAVARARLVRAAELLLAHPADTTLHGEAHRMLLADPVARGHHLPLALRRLTGGGGPPPPLDGPGRTLLTAVTGLLPSHPRAVLAALWHRLAAADRDPAAAVLLLETLAGVAGPPAVARRIAHLVHAYALRAGHGAADPVAAFVRIRLAQGAAARAVLHPLVGGLLHHGPSSQRAALGRLLVTDAGPVHGGLLDVLVHVERDPCVLVELVDAAARAGAAERLLGRLATLLSQAPDGRHALDRRLAGLASTLPGFRDRLRGWLAAAPDRWAPLVGAGARRVLDRPAPDAVSRSRPAAR